MSEPKRDSGGGPSRTQAALELVLADLFWGFGFVATVWAMRAMGPLTLTGWRFALAALVGIAIIFIAPGLRAQLSLEQFRLAAIPGFLISATLVFQAWGLRYTTATKSGLITTLYVVLVPLGEWLWLKKRPPKTHFFYVILAFVGMWLICGLGLGSKAHIETETKGLALNIGDLLTFCCAVTASLHILWLARIQRKIRSSFVFNSFQSTWAASVPLLLAMLIERQPISIPSFSDNSLTGFLSLVFGSTLIAFALQVRAQKVLSPSLASLLFLLEAPITCITAFFFLAESLGPLQWLGAICILIAAILSTLTST